MTLLRRDLVPFASVEEWVATLASAADAYAHRDPEGDLYAASGNAQAVPAGARTCRPSCAGASRPTGADLLMRWSRLALLETLRLPGIVAISRVCGA